jgi:PAS domain S-box-containing protein
LQKSERKYHSLFENLLEGYAYCSMIYDDKGHPADFIYLEVNRAFNLITGTTTVTGKPVTVVYPGIKDEFPELFEIYGKVATGGVPETFDLNFRPAGKWLHISVYSPAKHYFVAIFEDITMRRKAEEVQTLLASIVTQSEDAVYSETPEGIITSWNAGAEKMFGFTPEEAIGKHAIFLAPAEFADDITSVLARVRAGEPVVNHETIRVRKNGERLTVSLNISPIKNPDGEIIRASTIVRDITEQKRAQIVLEQINRKLSLLNSITHHDAGNKISGLRAYLCLLRESAPDPGLQSYFDKIDSIIEDLTEQIEFTRSYQNLGMKNPEWQDITYLIATLPAGSITITTKVAGLKIFADPLLGNVFYNLLDNAIRHGERVAEITVTAQETDHGLSLVWEDDGAGVPADIKDKIFDKGFGKNTGLGLFLIREILSISGITIQENGTPGKGARFEIRVPRGMYGFNRDLSGSM